MKKTAINRQLDPGSYRVFESQGTTQVDTGMVFVEGSSSSLLVEHWVLFKDFKSPTSTKAMQVEELSTTQSYSSLSAFLSSADSVVNGTDFLYVKATCEYSTELPS